ncbi:hypothetical protein QR680_006716 [Steinernema hermaphroditum]|uniref:Peptidase M12A domain-containing protein n=1 Tax=Steinernema hermaphroditum TaxID=289476 RepID=A0AA39HYS8_9BILA|nr:hypothetical protein QR680_006716 [Steinernema hermaphroditum]
MRTLGLLLVVVVASTTHGSPCVPRKSNGHTLVWNIDGNFLNTESYRNIKTAMEIWRDTTCLDISTDPFAVNSSIAARIWFHKRYGCDKVGLESDDFGPKVIVDPACVGSIVDAVNYIYTSLKVIGESCESKKHIVVEKETVVTGEDRFSFEDVKRINDIYCGDVCPAKNCNSGFMEPRLCSQCICPQDKEGENCEITSTPAVCGPHVNLTAKTTYQSTLNYGRGTCGSVILAPPGYNLQGRIKLKNFDGPECHGDICHCTPTTGFVRIQFFDRDLNYQGDQKYCDQSGRIGLTNDDVDLDPYPIWQVNYAAPKSAMRFLVEFVAVRVQEAPKQRAEDVVPLASGPFLGLVPFDA